MKKTAVVGVRELRVHLSAYLRRVSRGESAIVGDRQRNPVARLVPIRRGKEDEWLELLAERGLVTAPSAPFTLPSRFGSRETGCSPLTSCWKTGVDRLP